MKFGLKKLETSLYRMMMLNHLDVDHEFDSVMFKWAKQSDIIHKVFVGEKW